MRKLSINQSCEMYSIGDIVFTGNINSTGKNLQPCFLFLLKLKHA